MVNKSKSIIKNSLLSSDFYLRECEYRNPKNYDEFLNILIKSAINQTEIKIFLDGISAIKYFSKITAARNFEKVSIYIHKGDVIPTEAMFKKMHNFGIKLYSVNWLGDKEICSPIPIGIPSGSFNKLHGEFIYSQITKDPNIEFPNLTYEYYMNFDLTTNIIQRKAALETFFAKPGTFLPTRRLSERDHLSAIARSNYVISPPGAGADCYRTWEAIYLGAIPIVLADYWPFSHLDLPVKVVKSYSDFFEEKSAGEGRLKPSITEDFIFTLRDKFR